MVEQIMQDLGSGNKGGRLHMSVLDCLGFDSEIPGEMLTRQLFTDIQSLSIANNSTIYPASNTQFQLVLKQQNCVMDLSQTYLVGRFFSPTGFPVEYKDLFQVLQYDIGEVSKSLAFAHYENKMIEALEKKSYYHDFAQGSLHAGSESFVSSSFDNYTAGSIPTIKNVVSGSLATTTVETLDPYQVAARKKVDKYLARSMGNYFTYSGTNYSSTTFAVPLSEVCPDLPRYLPLVLGQQLRIVAKTTQNNECLFQVFSSGSTAGDFGLTNMGIYASWFNLSSDDLNNVLRSRIGYPATTQLSYQIYSAGQQQTLNSVFNVSAGSKLRHLMIGWFSQMTNANVLADSTDTSGNMLPSLSQINVAQNQYQQSQLNYFPQPSIQQIILQCGSQQRVVNLQQLRILHLGLDGKPCAFEDDPVCRQMNRPLFIDLTRYSDILDEYGSSVGGSASLIVQILQTGTGAPISGVGSTQDRTIPYQTTDWQLGHLQSLKCMMFLRTVDDMGLEQVNGVFHA